MKRRALAGQVPTTAPATATARLALRLPSGWGNEKRARGSGQFITTSGRGHPKWWFSKGIPQNFLKLG